MKFLPLGILATVVFVVARKRADANTGQEETPLPVVEGLFLLQRMMNRLASRVEKRWQEVPETGKLDDTTKAAYTEMVAELWEWRNRLDVSENVVALDPVLRWSLNPPQQALPPNTFFVDTSRIRRLTDALGRIYYGMDPTWQ